MGTEKVHRNCAGPLQLQRDDECKKEKERQKELKRTCFEESKAYPDGSVLAFIGHLSNRKPPAHLVSAASELDEEHKKKLAFEMMQWLVASDLSEDEDGFVSERAKVES